MNIEHVKTIMNISDEQYIYSIYCMYVYVCVLYLYINNNVVYSTETTVHAEYITFFKHL